MANKDRGRGEAAPARVDEADGSADPDSHIKSLPTVVYDAAERERCVRGGACPDLDRLPPPAPDRDRLPFAIQGPSIGGRVRGPPAPGAAAVPRPIPACGQAGGPWPCFAASRYPLAAANLLVCPSQRFLAPRWRVTEEHHLSAPVLVAWAYAFCFLFHDWASRSWLTFWYRWTLGAVRDALPPLDGVRVQLRESTGETVALLALGALVGLGLAR